MSIETTTETSTQVPDVEIPELKLEVVVLPVSDVDRAKRFEVARAALVGRGVDVSEVFHDAGGVFYHAGTRGRVPGPAPERATYGSFASFKDPDGNSWMLQEITTRLPGR